MEALVAAVEGTAFARWAAGPAYPYVNSLHLLGLVMLVGAIGLVDLRLVGAFSTLPRETLVGALTPVAIAGLLLLVASGSALFAADARALLSNPAFLWKAGLIATALANALLFRQLWQGGEPAFVARLLALASLALWLAIATLGRFIAYV